MGNYDRIIDESELSENARDGNVTFGTEREIERLKIKIIPCLLLWLWCSKHGAVMVQGLLNEPSTTINVYSSSLGILVDPRVFFARHEMS